MDEKKVMEAIKEFEIEVQVFEDMISYCKHFEPKNDCGRYEEKIAMRKTAIEALEKQLAKKPQTSKRYYKCPVCTTIRSLRQKHNHNYCYDCGQKLDWSE